ncbi:MAG: class I SAM-dependent DNA methyltransferase, partial [Thermoguttaceae bacterium]|nr:class I SAM-dependent DNA methyltransferase [Thermoguttaceae bacterium]
RWRDCDGREEANGQDFCTDFLGVFGVTKRKVATFEYKVKKLDEGAGYIDMLWKRMLLVEMKSRGKDLEKAAAQAFEYVDALPESELPRGVLVSDFDRFVYYDLEDGRSKTEFPLDEFPERVGLFVYLAGYWTRKFVPQDPVNFKAATLMGRLHDALKGEGYEQRDLERFLTRLLFCMFADDSAIFEKDDMLYYVQTRTAPDGSDLGCKLAHFFEILDKPVEKRAKRLDSMLAAFPYINGKLFAEPLPTFEFDKDLRDMLIKCCELDWSKISPAIFGALFQCAMIPEMRRNLGAHYTSEENVLKAIEPLFTLSLRAELNEIVEAKIAKEKKIPKLKAFHEKLASLKFLDPACGCGNFLVVAYRELRLLELDVLKELFDAGEKFLDVSTVCKVNVNQFYGIEIEENPAQIARLALWLTDHQMNLKVGEIFGEYFARIPIQASPTIVCGNALRIDWETVVPKSELSYILGNPPFVGFHLQSKEQREEVREIFGDSKSSGVLDYVACWYKKAA